MSTSSQHSNRWFWLLVGICSLEIFFVQEATLIAPHSQTLASAIFDRVFRLLLDTLACGAALAIFSSRARIIGFGVVAFFELIVLTYHNYFHQPLSARMVVSSLGEGVGVADAGLQLVPAAYSLVVVALIVKLVIVLKREPRVRPRLSALLFFAYLAALVVINATYKPMNRLATWESVAGVGAVYGYLPTWSAELLVFDNAQLLARALKRAEKTQSKALSSIEAPLEFGEHIVFLQVESLDWPLIDFKIKGQEVIPRINALRATSRVYAVRAEKLTGSCDSDFKALMATQPSNDVPTYKIDGYPYASSIIAYLNSVGFETAAFHGVSGQFFSRRPAYERMAFDQLYFREELVARGLPAEGWSVLDHRVLDFAAQALQEKKKQFSFIITATSHIPFHHLPNEAGTFFPGSTQIHENYFDVMHYVDHAVGAYVDHLPSDTTLVMYGDHSSQVVNSELGYAQVEYRRTGIVPFMIYRSGVDLSASQRVDPELASSGKLTLLDATSYVHHWIRVSR